MHRETVELYSVYKYFKLHNMSMEKETQSTQNPQICYKSYYVPTNSKASVPWPQNQTTGTSDRHLSLVDTCHLEEKTDSYKHRKRVAFRPSVGKCDTIQRNGRLLTKEQTRCIPTTSLYLTSRKMTSMLTEVKWSEVKWSELKWSEEVKWVPVKFLGIKFH